MNKQKGSSEPTEVRVAKWGFWQGILVALIAGLFTLAPLVNSPQKPDEKVSILNAILLWLQPGPSTTDTIATAVAATLAAQVPTPDYVGTGIAGTLTSQAPVSTFTLLPENIAETMIAQTKSIGVLTPSVTTTFTQIPDFTLTSTPIISSQQIATAIPTSFVPASTGGCKCLPEGCQGVIVSKDTSVPASSIFEPAPGSRGIIYQYNVAGKTPTEGSLWVYVNDNNQPANLSCVEAQLISFTYDHTVTVVDESSSLASAPLP